MSVAESDAVERAWAKPAGTRRPSHPDAWAAARGVLAERTAWAPTPESATPTPTHARASSRSRAHTAHAGYVCMCVCEELSHTRWRRLVGPVCGDVHGNSDGGHSGLLLTPPAGTILCFLLSEGLGPCSPRPRLPDLRKGRALPASPGPPTPEQATAWRSGLSSSAASPGSPATAHTPDLAGPASLTRVCGRGSTGGPPPPRSAPHAPPPPGRPCLGHRRPAPKRGAPGPSRAAGSPPWCLAPAGRLDARIGTYLLGGPCGQRPAQAGEAGVRPAGVLRSRVGQAA